MSQLLPTETESDSRTPPRSPSSLRRTTTVDMWWPQGDQDPLVLSGRGRDLLTTASGDPMVHAETAVEGSIRFFDGGRIATLEATPSDSALGDLIGTNVKSGFRGSLAGRLAHQRGSLLFLMLDELPIVTHIATTALPDHGISLRTPMLDICAGWAADGALATIYRRTNRHPNAISDTIAPLVGRTDDPDAWHELPILPHPSVRRHRRLDLRLDDVDGSGPVVNVDGMFRDVLVEPDGRPRVMHEYSLTAALDPVERILVAVDATPHVVPGTDCPNAVASAQHLVGRHLSALRRAGSAELRGNATCTHLNDALRALGDIDTLIETLAAI